MWTAAEMAPAIHFVNCHGAEFDPNWYGQQSPNNWNLPDRHRRERASRPGARGAVVASECCYGTSHWPPCEDYLTAWLDLGVYQSDHDANGQYEINFHYADALTTADRFIFFKMLASEVARKHRGDRDVHGQTVRRPHQQRRRGRGRYAGGRADTLAWRTRDPSDLATDETLTGLGLAHGSVACWRMPAPCAPLPRRRLTVTSVSKSVPG